MIAYLQQFIYNKLTKEENFKNVFFQVPSGSSFPYIFIGDFVSKDISSRGVIIKEISFNIIFYHRDKSQKFAFEMTDKLKHALQINNFQKIILIKPLEEKIIFQNDGVTQQILMKFKCIVQG